MTGFAEGDVAFVLTRDGLEVLRRARARPFPAGGACDIGAIEAVFGSHAFSDVTNFYEATVRWITSDVNTPTILTGYNDNTFRQKLNISRGQVARMYHRAAGAPDVSGLPPHEFTDVTAFFEDAVRWAKANGIFDGFDDDTFRQRDNIKRGNASRISYNLAQTPAAWDDPTTAYPNMLFRPNAT